MEQIVDAALTVIAAGGIAGLTTRRLATQLGVAQMTLYSYVRTKDELIDRVAEGALRALLSEMDATGDWRRALGSAAGAIRRRMREAPGTLDVLLIARDVSTSSLDPLRERMLAPLLEAGFPAALAVAAATDIQTYAFGFALLERAHPRAGEAEVDRLSRLDESSYPALRAAAAEYADRFSDDHFERGLEALLDRIGCESGGCQLRANS
jgi:AcrR family transcriptional regulator